MLYDGTFYRYDRCITLLSCSATPSTTPPVWTRPHQTCSWPPESAVIESAVIENRELFSSDRSCRHNSVTSHKAVRCCDRFSHHSPLRTITVYHLSEIAFD